MPVTTYQRPRSLSFSEVFASIVAKRFGTFGQPAVLTRATSKTEPRSSTVKLADEGAKITHGNNAQGGGSSTLLVAAGVVPRMKKLAKAQLKLSKALGTIFIINIC